MRRDMDMIRIILLAVEHKSTSEGVRIEEFEVDGIPDSSERRKQFVSMMEAGFFSCEPSRSSTNPDRIYGGLVFDLSWRGHEYLDAIRDPEIWHQTKSGAKKAGNASFDFLIELAKSAAKRALSQSGIGLLG